MTRTLRRATSVLALVITASLCFALQAPVGGAQAARSHGVLWGAYIDGSVTPAVINSFEAKAHKRASIVSWVGPWYYGGRPQPFNTALFRSARAGGHIPMLDWAPWDGASWSNNQPAFRLQRIISGKYDSYIRAWATAARRWGHPLFLRFGEEMNGTWYSWSESANGNRRGQFVAAWRHVHNIFRSVRAKNVTWVWNPNTVYPGSIPLARLYPGAAYVDWTAIDGYNWGTNPVKPGNSWQTFSQIFTPTYRALEHLAPSKPIMIAETASTNHGGSKAAWITDAFKTQLPSRFPRIRAVVWFDANNADSIGTEDWALGTGPNVWAAFASAISSPVYRTNRYARLSRSPIPAP